MKELVRLQAFVTLICVTVWRASSASDALEYSQTFQADGRFGTYADLI